MRPAIGRFVNIAHRGASGHAPENSAAAARLGVTMGADYVELDVRRTRDGAIVAFHDTTIDRTTDGSGLLGEHSLAELRALDAGTWFDRAHAAAPGRRYAGTPVSTLDDIIAAVAGAAGLYIEAKAPAEQPGLEGDLVGALERLGALDPARLVLQAFGPASLLRYAELAPAIPRVQLLDYRADAAGALAEASGLLPAPARATGDDFADLAGPVTGVAPNATAGGREIVDADFVAAAHSAALFVHVYTVDDVEVMQRLMAAGVDGIFTNFPDRLAALRGRST